MDEFSANTTTWRLSSRIYFFLEGKEQTQKISQKICRENGNLVYMYVVRFLMPTECNLTYFCSYLFEKENNFQGHLQLATWWIFCPWKTNRINSKTALSYVCSRHSKNSSHFFFFFFHFLFTLGRQRINKTFICRQERESLQQSKKKVSVLKFF